MKHIDIFYLEELAETMTAAQISRHLGIPDATIRDNLMRLDITAQKCDKNKNQLVMYKGFEITRTHRGNYSVNNGGAVYVSKEVAMKCIDVYLERTK